MTSPATHSLAPNHAQTRKSKIAFVGSYWGVEEAQARAPFVGRSGKVFWRILSDAGISRSECFITNVINQLIRSDGDLCGPKATALAGYPSLGKVGFVRAEFAGELTRLGEELLLSDPNIIVAMGSLPMWALCAKTAITQYRGYITESTHTAIGFKVLPTFNPAHIYRQWQNRATVVLDFLKAKKESESATINRPHREIHIPERVIDLYDFDSLIRASRCLSIDIETYGSIVTCIGFSDRPDRAMVVPIYDRRSKTRCFWEDRDFVLALEWIKDVLSRPQPKVFQNGLYDIAFLYRSLGFEVHGAQHDTMLLHHSLQPESLKSLEYLGSLYTDEGAWKQMRKSSTIKAGS
jgi:uracil-DNA glycosylase